MSSAKLVVFSGVDSVLRQAHAANSFGKAARVLEALGHADVPIVLCSGKTRAEIEQIQHELGIRHPFVCERDGATFIPTRYFDFDVPRAREVAGYLAVEFGLPYTKVVYALHRTARRLAIEVVGFNEMSVDEVARDCHLPLPQARLAMLREYGEHFRVLDPADDARPRLFKALAGLGLRCVPGTPYDHVGAPVRNGTGVKFLCSLYERAHGTLLTLGLADAMADESILPLVDRRILVCDDGGVDGQVDVLAWAEAIVDSVEDLRREVSRGPRCDGDEHRRD
jgi:mannosyl-3-phosphoglycerate phosphatase